ncbi:hypothetical protein [Roseobacter fucihabitans]|nr:hypothetical protein [Roseobacter litoralis]
MSATRYFSLGLLIAFLATTVSATAQTTAGPPQFIGNRTTASSAGASGPSEEQGGASQQDALLPHTLIGAAILEAAREEGRHFVQKRKLEAAETGLD